MRSIGLTGLAVVVGALVGATVAQAEDFTAVVPVKIPVQGVDPLDRQWTLTIGGYLMGQPEYAGSDNYEAAFRPLFSISRADTLSRFRSFNDSPSIALIDEGFFEAGIAGQINWERKASDYYDLRGLNDVDYAYQIGGYAQWYPADWMRLRTEVRYGFGGFDGVVADFAADAIHFTEAWGGMALSAGPRLTLASSGYVDAYYGITPEEAAYAQFLGNNLTAYDPGGGIYSVGFGGQILKRFTPNILGSVFAEYKYLTGDAADSPIVVQNGSRNQFQAGVSLSYTFFLGIQ